MTAHRTLSYCVSTMKRTNGSERTKQNQIRMTDDLKERIHEYQKKVFKETGIELNFSETVRSLVEKSLKAAKL